MTSPDATTQDSYKTERGVIVIIAVDFDGTIVKHEYPEIGAPVGAFKWLLKFQELGAKLILWTMRDDGGEHGPVLTEAVECCRYHGVEFWGVNENPDQHWSKSPKAYAKIYIDDMAIGCPLVYPETGRPYVDWNVVGPEVTELIKKGAGK